MKPKSLKQKVCVATIKAKTAFIEQSCVATPRMKPKSLKQKVCVANLEGESAAFAWYLENYTLKRVNQKKF
jgi:hypothetical protein